MRGGVIVQWTESRTQVENSQALVCKSMQVSILNCSNMQEPDSGTLDKLLKQLKYPKAHQWSNFVIFTPLGNLSSSNLADSALGPLALPAVIPQRLNRAPYIVSFLWSYLCVSCYIPMYSCANQRLNSAPYIVSHLWSYSSYTPMYCCANRRSFNFATNRWPQCLQIMVNHLHLDCVGFNFLDCDFSNNAALVVILPISSTNSDQSMDFWH